MEDEEKAVATEEQIEPATSLLGAPPGWMQPMPPITFDYQPKFNAPVTWEEVDNPGSWSKYTFQPRFDKRNYTSHYTPTRAQVLPPTPNGSRVIDD